MLTLEEVFGAITFYLANRSTIDAYLAEGEKQVESLRQQSREASPQLYATSRRWREQKLSGAAG